CEESGAAAAGLYLKKGGLLDLELAVGERALPQEIDLSALPADLAALPLPGGALLVSPAAAVASQLIPVMAPLPALVATAARGCQLRRQLKEQHFQVNYRVVELEALYDVGLAIAGTLDLEQLSEEILLRAVSLLDARRGALYLLEGGAYRAVNTFGGDAGAAFAAADHLAGFLDEGTVPPEILLPGARYLLAVPIAIEDSPRGLLVVGDRETRRGVGPFQPSDRRTLALFANQAAIALENARLHRQALDKERLERELVLAAEIQRRLLPKEAPTVAGYALAGWNRPARQVGGDYWDVWKLGPGRAGGAVGETGSVGQGGDPSRVGLVLGDVSGKGMPAALMVSTLHSALRLLLDGDGLGPVFLERLNRHICDSSTSNKFITLLLAELDPETGGLVYLNAGHNPALLLRGDGKVDHLGPGGVPLGLIPAARYLAKTALLHPGDLLCIYSDGITEAASLADEEFGMDRLATVLAENRDRPLADVVAAVDREVTAFAQGQPQLDDQTLVLLRRDGV
ncbi:MAG TPA: SpoIIE family protein phosphatase, partial [Thermoanaerobaculia bacterium]|nr:SpoIIE family protein phosphatase [Thermoanaerobaculia bacterium]